MDLGKLFFGLEPKTTFLSIAENLLLFPLSLFICQVKRYCAAQFRACFMIIEFARLVWLLMVFGDLPEVICLLVKTFKGFFPTNAAAEGKGKACHQQQLIPMKRDFL
jgi:hypothetical protein